MQNKDENCCDSLNCGGSYEIGPPHFFQLLERNYVCTAKINLCSKSTKDSARGTRHFSKSAVDYCRWSCLGRDGN